MSAGKFLLTGFSERSAVMKVRSSYTRNVCYNLHNFSFICCKFSRAGSRCPVRFFRFNTNIDILFDQELLADRIAVLCPQTISKTLGDLPRNPVENLKSIPE